MQQGREFDLVFQTQLLNLNNAMKFFLRILNASIHEALNLLPLSILLTEEKLVGSGETFVEMFIDGNDPNEMLLCLKI
jgi:hypothetical protein